MVAMSAFQVMNYYFDMTFSKLYIGYLFERYQTSFRVILQTVLEGVKLT